jgi:hypothetical protein
MFLHPSHFAQALIETPDGVPLSDVFVIAFPRIARFGGHFHFMKPSSFILHV